MKNKIILYSSRKSYHSHHQGIVYKLQPIGLTNQRGISSPINNFHILISDIKFTRNHKKTDIHRKIIYSLYSSKNHIQLFDKLCTGVKQWYTMSLSILIWYDNFSLCSSISIPKFSFIVSSKFFWTNRDANITQL